ncbi:MAG: right-handed parallel beta-helix repeat-containing protein [Ferruginibacter sp.]
MIKTGYNFFRLPFTWYLLPLCIVLFFSSCKKDSFITSGDARIATSLDSLKYDTVFTSIGSITKSFKINNLNTQKLLLSEVKLMGGANSSFKINVNGAPASELNNIEIASEDSIYIFVTANINPNTANLPFIVTDSIRIMFNGNTRFVQLEAFGQNANFLRNRIIKGDITWTNNLPYVILGSLQVDADASLTIEAGCKIYSHADAPFIVDGTLVAKGTKDDRVVFAGDRLDEDYRDLPASWPGIYFRGSSKNNVLTYTIVKNAYQAVVAEQASVNANPKITLHQCIIENAYDAGILCVNSSLAADNTLISNCGKNIYIIYGGNYIFTNCTAAAYSPYLSHKDPVLTANNFALQNGNTLTADLEAVFRNCIFWGQDGIVEDELNIAKQGNNNFDVLFDHCLYKSKNDPANSVFSAPVKNMDPLFDSIDVSRRNFNFHINNAQAPGLDKGIATGFLKDLDGNDRSIGLPDLGCYEKQ